MEIVVYSPEIAGNVGAIIRLSANSGVPVNFIKPFGFNMQENKIRRAGLDYHDLAAAKTYETWEEFIDINKGAKICSLTSKATEPYWNSKLNMYDFAYSSRLAAYSSRLADMLALVAWMPAPASRGWGHCIWQREQEPPTL